MNPLSVDVLVVGGGPAGLATALALRRQGELSVAVLDRSGSAPPPVGETLAPGARVLLEALGVWADFQQQEHLPAFGTAAAWGRMELAQRDFMMMPFGCGWTLDRQRFDALLATHLSALGGRLLSGAGTIEVERIEGGWEARLQGFETDRVRARFVIDATGRSAALARRLGAHLHFLDHQIAVLADFELRPDSVVENTTMVEAFEHGWCYSVKRPGPLLTVAILCDGDGAQMLRLSEPDGWQAALQALPHTLARSQECGQRGPLRCVTAHSARLDTFWGEGWLAVGDAACSHDPLSGSGIVRALDGGLRAARAVHAHLARGSQVEMRTYASDLQLSFERYTESYWRYYGTEARWRQAEFWKRRQPQVVLDPQQCLYSTAPGRLPAVPAHLLRVDCERLLRRADRGCPAHLLVAEHRDDSDCPDLAVVHALQWMTAVGVLQPALRKPVPARTPLLS